MSKTDKTDPYWVKVERYGVEHHNHRNNECDFEDNGPYIWPRQTWGYRKSCYKDLTWADMVTAFPAYKDPWSTPNKIERSVRAKLRSTLAEVRKAGDWEDVDVPPYRHRHGSTWWA